MRSLYKDKRITISSPEAKVCLIAAFFLPVLLLLIAAWRLRLAPFTDTCYMPNSMQETYLPVISELCHKVKNGESIFYTWNNGGGTSFWNLLACYAASPFTLIYLCFSEADIPKVTQAIFALRSAFASLAFCVLVWKKEKIISPLTVAISVSYGLSAYMLAYYEEPWFLDTLIWLPLLILGAHYLLSGKHNWLFIVSMAMIIISNWQSGLYVLVFIVAMYPLLMMEQRKEKFEFRKRLVNVKDFAIALIIALGLSAIVWFPVLKGILNSSLTDLQFRFPDDLNTNMKAWDLLDRFTFDSQIYTVSDASQFPGVYCGIFAVMLTIYYALASRIPFKEKLYSLSALLFFYIIMANRFLSFIFSGIHYPITGTYPQAFLLVFMVMCMASKALASDAFIENHRNLRITVGIILAFMVINCAIATNLDYSDHKIYYALSFIAVYFVIIALMEKKNTPDQNRFLALIFAGILLVETTMSLYHPLKDRYFVRVTKGSNTESVVKPMSEDLRKTLLPNKKDEWEYRLSSAVTYNKPDEEIQRQVTEKTQAFGPGDRLAFLNTGSENAGLLYHVPSLNSSCYIQSDAYSSALKALGLSRSSKTIVETECVPWIEQFFSVSGKISLPSSDKEMGRGNLGYFSSSEMIYESLSDKISVFGTQNMFTALFSEGTVLDEIPYTVDSLQNTKDLKDGRFTIVSSRNMNEVDITIKVDYIKPIYILCSAEQQVVLEVTQYDDQDRPLDSHSVSETQSRVYCIEQPEENVDHIAVHMDFPSNKSETVKFAVASLNQENYEKLESTLADNGFRVSSISASEVEGDITAPTSGNLLFTIPYDSGWSVSVDGQKTKTFAGCNAFLSIHLTEGEHHVTMKYEPPQFDVAVASLVIFALLTVCVSLSSVFTCKKKKKTPVVTEMNEADEGKDI